MCKECRNKRNRELDRKLRKQVLEILGHTCSLCGRETIEKGRDKINLHEIHGKPHDYSHYYRFKYVLDNIKDFIPLCRSCHFTVHIFAKNPERLVTLKRLVRMILRGI